ncbi:MAG: hypothetical protein LBK24_01580, partial [Puniceicoccales bacterium]|nr:hypothetical protein [Puniceicoccales bacterium]
MDSIGTSSSNVFSRHDTPPQGQGNPEITAKAMSDGSVELTSDETCKMTAKPGDQREVEAVAEKTSANEVKLQDEAARKDPMDAAWRSVEFEMNEFEEEMNEKTEQLMRTKARRKFDAVLKGDPTAFREAQDRALDIVWNFTGKAEQENARAEANHKIAKIEREFLRVKNKMAVTNLVKASVVCEEIHKEAKNAFDAE